MICSRRSDKMSCHGFWASPHIDSVGVRVAISSHISDAEPLKSQAQHALQDTAHYDGRIVSRKSDPLFWRPTDFHRKDTTLKAVQLEALVRLVGKDIIGL